MNTNQFTQPNRIHDFQLAHTKGSLKIFDKLGIKLNMQWDLLPIGLSVRVNIQNPKEEIGRANLTDGDSVNFSGVVNNVTHSKTTIRLASNPMRLYFSTKAAHKPFIGNWKCVSAKEQVIYL